MVTGAVDVEHLGGDAERPGGDAATSDAETGEEEFAAGDDVLATLTSHIHAAALSKLPPPVRRRIRALKTLQKEVAELNAKFKTEVHALECKYAELYQPLFDKRATVVNATYEPIDEECVNAWVEDSDDNKGDVIIELKDGEDATADDKPLEMDADVKGIPEFWYTVFKNAPILSELMEEHDEPIIKKLQDIKLIMHEDPMGFTLQFHFAPNEYFSNAVLTKEYLLKCIPDDKSPLEFEDPEVFSRKGCDINWYEGKDVTSKIVNKRQRHKFRGSIRVVTKSVKADSFFNFFATPTDPETPDWDDFEIGNYFREEVVPRAVLLYTGEGVYDDDSDVDDDEESFSDEVSGTEEASDALDLD